MSDTYTKLFSSITESTVWGESYATRIVWVTMLAMADAGGNVYGAIPGLARRANVTLQEVETALASFMAPDPYSRTKDHDGRRIEEIDGGWRLINHGKYKTIRDKDERRSYQREWDSKHRPSGHQRARKSDSSPTDDPQSDHTPTVRQQSDSSPTNPTSPTPPTPTPYLKAEEQKQEHVQPAAARSRFDDFWKVYPIKKGRQEAEKSWRKQKLDARCDELIAHVRLMVELDSDWHEGYIPMGSTYLNQARWQDEPKRPPTPTQRAGPNAAPTASKTLIAARTLQGMKHGNLALRRDSGRPDKAALPELGADTGVGRHQLHRDGVG